MSTEQPSEYPSSGLLADDSDARLILDALTDTAIFQLDTNGVVQQWYAGARALLGYDAEEVAGRHVSKFLPHGTDGKWINDALARALTQKTHVKACWLERRNGYRFRADVTITALFGQQDLHRGFAVAMRLAEDENHDVPAESGGGRIAAFMDVLAHELRNPLAPIANAIAILDRVPDLSENVRHVRDIIVRQSRQMTQVIDGLLDISRISEGKVELDRKPVRLDAVISEAVRSAESLIQIQSHTLTVEGCENAVWVNGDRARLIQIIGNLLHNAAKFTPQCGVIHISLGVEDDEAVVKVADNGVGIDPARLQTLFSRFEQRDAESDKTFGGLGLGLSLAHELIRLHEGTITASSSGISGEGSAFSVRLPRIAGPVEEREPQRSSAMQTVLVVDDNRDSALVMTMLLEGMGYRCLTAYAGIDAVEIVKKERPDIVLLDIGLPDIDGYEVASRIADALPEPPPLIALTGYGGHHDRRRSFKAGFSAHVVKPVDPDNLQMLLHTILAD
jgi:PAS domain S-box-containing protein